MRARLKRIPIAGPLLTLIYRRAKSLLHPFQGSSTYWEDRYTAGGNSGAGSYGPLATFKADVLNGFVKQEKIDEVIELGCGDGHQLSLATYPRYLGFDVSEEALRLCRRRFAGDASRSFKLLQELGSTQAPLSLSLDVIYHLVEDSIFERHMEQLFDASSRFVIIYASNTDENPVEQIAHVRHRAFGRWVSENRPDWKLKERIANAHPFEGDQETGSCADFYIYMRAAGGTA